jgi:hypothetical protein
VKMQCPLKNTWQPARGPKRLTYRHLLTAVVGEAGAVPPRSWYIALHRLRLHQLNTKRLGRRAEHSMVRSTRHKFYARLRYSTAGQWQSVIRFGEYRRTLRATSYLIRLEVTSPFLLRFPP